MKEPGLRSCTAPTSGTTTTATATCCRRSSHSTGPRWCTGLVPAGLQGYAPAGQFRRTDYDPAEVRSDQPSRRPADVAHVTVARRRDGHPARSGRGHRRRIAGALRRVVHGVVSRRGQSVEHHQLPHRERQRPVDLAALYPPAADRPRVERASGEQGADDVPSPLAGRLVAHVGYRPPAGDRDARVARDHRAAIARVS